MTCLLWNKWDLGGLCCCSWTFYESIFDECKWNWDRFEDAPRKDYILYHNSGLNWSNFHEISTLNSVAFQIQIRIQLLKKKTPLLLETPLNVEFFRNTTKTCPIIHLSSRKQTHTINHNSIRRIKTKKNIPEIIKNSLNYFSREYKSKVLSHSHTHTSCTQNIPQTSPCATSTSSHTFITLNSIEKKKNPILSIYSMLVKFNSINRGARRNTRPSFTLYNARFHIEIDLSHCTEHRSIGLYILVSWQPDD